MNHKEEFKDKRIKVNYLIVAQGWWAWVRKPSKEQWMFLACPKYYASFAGWQVEVGKF